MKPLDETPVRPMICFWDAMHPDGDGSPLFDVEVISKDFKRLWVFSMSNYVRNLLSDEIYYIQLDFPDTAARMNWINRIYCIDSQKASDGMILNENGNRMNIDYVEIDKIELCKKISFDDRGEDFINWTGNDQSGRAHHGSVPMSPSRRNIQLHWKEATSSQSRLIGCFCLNLNGLLDRGYIQREN
jgi:hypothetical protein